MQHCSKDGKSKLLKNCSLPLTGIRCVTKIVSDLAVLDVTPQGFVLLERAPEVSLEYIQSVTEGKLIINREIPEIKF
jgi:3-oxoacid CoA-transferase subunit B